MQVFLQNKQKVERYNKYNIFFLNYNNITLLLYQRENGLKINSKREEEYITNIQQTNKYRYMDEHKNTGFELTQDELYKIEEIENEQKLSRNEFKNRKTNARRFEFYLQ